MTAATDNTGTDFADDFRNMPEAKLELVNGQLLAGNSLDGSRLLLWQILRGWGAEAAIALGSIETWYEALAKVYQLWPSAADETLNELASQAAAVPFQAPDFSRGREGANAGHRQACSHLHMALYRAAEQLGGQALGRDFTLRLGEDGFTPDMFYFKGWRKSQLYEYYLEGPAELVIEVTRPAHEHYDRVLKRDLYARGGVPEYLIVNPARRAAEFLRLAHGEYRDQTPDEDGCYRPASVPGLAIRVDYLWAKDDFNWEEPTPFIIEHPARSKDERRSRRDGWEWGSVPFAPRFELRPEPILFVEYISWCPEAKFEWVDGRPLIAGREATRNVLGLLLMTTGLYEAVQMLPARDWVAALQSHLCKARADAARRAQWWQKAQTLARMLREKYGIQRLGVAGDLLRQQPLDYWSELELVGWETPREQSHLIYQDIVPHADAVVSEIHYSDADDHYFKERLKRTGATIQEIQ